MQVKLLYIRLFNSFSACTNIEAILKTTYFTVYEGSLRSLLEMRFVRNL